MLLRPAMPASPSKSLLPITRPGVGMPPSRRPAVPAAAAAAAARPVQLRQRTASHCERREKQ